jgi:hypothetical protein
MYIFGINVKLKLVILSENIGLGYFSQENFKKLVNSNDCLYESLNKIRKISIFKYYKVNLNEIIKNSYKNKKYMNYICNRIYDFYKDFTLSQYLDNHLMYIFVLDVDITKLDLEESVIDEIKEIYGKDWEKLVLIKIGYTFELIERIKALQNKFKCNLYLIGLKYVNSQADEKLFHNKILKKSYKDSSYKLIIKMEEKNKVLSDETYIGNLKIIKEFDNYDVKIHNQFLTEKEKGKNLDKELKLKDSELKLKDKEIELEKVKGNNEIKLKDKEIELLKLQIEFKKSEKNT